jgi:hypoxanthine-DNA glycosylase
MNTELKHSFAPLIDQEAKILILGSIPGDKSIELQEYYGHAQNRFWRVLTAICGYETVPTDYLSKKSILIQNKIALWDVAHKANRKGSLDSAIRDEEPNDIASLLEKYPTIKTIAFNGKKAEQLYDRYFQRSLHIKYLSMPSTSPANAIYQLDLLSQKWSALRG